ANLTAQKKFWREKLGLNLPLFYVELSDLARPDTLYKFENANQKEAVKRLLSAAGNWQEIAGYCLSVQKLNSLLQRENIDSALLQINSKEELRNALNETQTAANLLLSAYDQRYIEFQLQVIEANLSFLKASATLNTAFNQVKHDYSSILQNKSTWKNYIPVLHFHLNNQYHRWLFGDGNWLSGAGSKFSQGLVRGDFGTSFASKEAVSKKIWSRLQVSVFFSLLSIILAYLISIPLAARAALKPHSHFDRLSGFALFSLYSLPSFFLATLLLMTFANPGVLNWFPASGLQPASGIPENTGILETARIHLAYCILPLICFTYSSLAFLSRSMRSALLENLSLDYIRTARAKGLSERSVVYRHAFKNALLPIITLFANVFPYAIGGSVILETIFTLPGMGLETYTAIQNQDYPVIVAVFTLTGFMTLLGTLLADILYAFADPRISFTKTA
ncbi:MAG: ABC transporter permease, partial [Bacteroidota bacterium]